MFQKLDSLAKSFDAYALTAATEDHVYTILSIDSKYKKVTVANPWHTDQLESLTYEEFFSKIQRYNRNESALLI